MSTQVLPIISIMADPLPSISTSNTTITTTATTTSAGSGSSPNNISNNSNSLPSLDSILVKIQSEQRQPLPAPSTNILPNPRESANPILPSLSYSSDPFLNKLPTGPPAYHGFPSLARNSLPTLPAVVSVPASRSTSYQSLTGLPPFLRPSSHYTTSSAAGAAASVNDSSSAGSAIVIPRKYRCKVCSKTFTTSGHLARHNRIHTGVKNHVCPYEGCGARFSRQDNCMQHYKTHVNKKGRKRSKITPASELLKESDNDTTPLSSSSSSTTS